MTCLPGLNVYSLLVVDLLHEVELGVWKSLFTHIIRMLQFHSPGAIGMLDERWLFAVFTRVTNVHALSQCRFRRITPFGKDGIRRFIGNASQMKRLAAHNYEDLLQVWAGHLPRWHHHPDTSHSASCQCLMASCQSPTALTFWTLCL